MRNDLEPTQPMEPTHPAEPAQPAQPYAPAQPMRPMRPVRRDDDPRVPASYSTARIVYLVLGIVEALLIIRIVLKLLAANPDAGFSSLIYGITAPLVALFQGVFPNAQGNGSVLDAAAILAMIVYALVAWGIVRLIAILSRRDPLPTA